MPKSKPLFFDTVVLSNFAFVQGGIAFLKERYRGRGKITLQVLEEVAKAIYAGLSDLEQIESDLLQKNGFEKTSLTTKEQTPYLHLLRNLGDGEASCIAAAFERNAIVVTDDRMARNFCKERNIAVTGTLGILKASYIDGSLQIDDADRMLAQMIACGFYSPVQKISDTLP